MTSRKMLLVEDDQSFVQLVKLALKDLDFELEVANDGLVALNLLSKSHFDLIVCDYRLPHINGTEIIRTLTKNSPNCKVILMSAANVENLAVDLEEVPLVGILQKPCTPIELRDVVERAS